MIPPLKDMRLRSIMFYLREYRPGLTAKELETVAQDWDDAMMEAFDQGEDAIKEELMRSGVWGRDLTVFPTRLLMLWQQVREEFLPLTTSPSSEV